MIYVIGVFMHPCRNKNTQIMKKVNFTKKEWSISLIIHSLLLGLAFLPFLHINQEKEDALQVVVMDFTQEVTPISKESKSVKTVPDLATSKKKSISEIELESKKIVEAHNEVIEAPKPMVVEVPIIVEEPKPKVETVSKEIVIEEKVEVVIEEEVEVIEDIDVIEEIEVEELIEEVVEEEIVPVQEEPVTTQKEVEISIGDIEQEGVETETELIDKGTYSTDSSGEGEASTTKPGSGFIEGDGALNRPIIFRNDPKSLAKKSGTIVVKVCINRKGMVSYAEYDIENSTIHDPKIKELVMADVLDYRFEKSYSAPEKECGRLSYHFKFN